MLQYLQAKICQGKGQMENRSFLSFFGKITSSQSSLVMPIAILQAKKNFFENSASL
jgi:hypothetical protein